MTGFGDSVARIAAALAGEDDTRGDWAGNSADLIAEIQQQQERDYAAKCVKWERDRPMRERAEAAWQAAHERRQAEAGRGYAGQGQVFAAFGWLKPEPPAHMR
jgi:hypothetical protein